METILCACGCGEKTKLGAYRRGHERRVPLEVRTLVQNYRSEELRIWRESLPLIACACGCGTLIPPIDKYYQPSKWSKGHNKCRGRKHGGRITKPCKWCGEPVTKLIRQIELYDNTFCGKSCWASYVGNSPEIRVRLRGPAHPHWKGGATPINQIERKSKRYKDWRTAVFRRDNYTCQDCGKRGVYLQAHHIKKWSDFIELRFEVPNGKTLCKPCHDRYPK